MPPAPSSADDGDADVAPPPVSEGAPGEASTGGPARTGSTPVDEVDLDDDPDGLGGEPDMCYFELIDPATGVTYYVHSDTGESSWVRGHKLAAARARAAAAEGGWRQVRWCVWCPQVPPKWIDVYDDNTGYYYYTNTKVGGHCAGCLCRE